MDKLDLTNKEYKPDDLIIEDMEAKETYFLTVSGKRKLATFICRIVEKVIDKDKNANWKIRLENENETKTFIISGVRFFNPAKFAYYILKKGMFFYLTTSKHRHSEYIKFLARNLKENT